MNNTTDSPSSFRRRCARFVVLSSLGMALSVSAAEPLRLTKIELPAEGGVRLQFADPEASSGSYVIERAMELVPGGEWFPASHASLVPLGDRSYEVLLGEPATASGFFRVRRLANTGPVEVHFESRTVRADEGSGEIQVPLVFSAPYQGTVRYRVEGTAGPDDAEPLSGELLVDGVAAVITVRVKDNAEIGRFRFLTLALETGPDMIPTEPFETLVEIAENDVAWQGTFAGDTGTFGFGLEVLTTGDSVRGVLKGGTAGLFPATGHEAIIARTADLFSAVARGVPLTAEDTFLATPAELEFELLADASQSGEVVTAAQVRGRARLTVHVPGKPHLASTNTGSFLLLVPPARPSTNEVQLTTLR